MTLNRADPRRRARTASWFGRPGKHSESDASILICSPSDKTLEFDGDLEAHAMALGETEYAPPITKTYLPVLGGEW